MNDPLRPLADRMRPRNLGEFVGQRHLLGPGKPLSASIEAGQLHSLILWGPPGTGKTTLARLIAKAANAEFIALSAVMAGVKDIRAAVEAARTGASTRRATSSTTRSPRSTRPSAAPIPTARFTGSAACSMVAVTRCTSPGG